MTLSLDRPTRAPVGEGWSAAQLALVAASRRLDAEEWILVEQTSKGSWIVRDRRVLAGGRTLVGCIEKHGDVYQARQVGSGIRWDSFGTLDAAVQNLMELAPASTASAVDDQFPLPS
jgi:hypothetical protein